MKAAIIIAVVALYLLGGLDVFFVKLGLPLQLYDCYTTGFGQVYCTGPASISKPPKGMPINDGNGGFTYY